MFLPLCLLLWILDISEVHGVGNDDLVNNLKVEGIIKTQKVKATLSTVDRGDFTHKKPYKDVPQFIGQGSVIPSASTVTVALETLAEKLNEGAMVLDIGSGSGYMTALLASMVGETGKVYGVDHIPELTEIARANIMKSRPKFLDKERVVLLTGDGRLGLPEYAPFDVIYVGAAAKDKSVSDVLVEQLKPGGRLLIPISAEEKETNLVQIDKNEGTGEVTRKVLLYGVDYIPLTEAEEQLTNQHKVHAQLELKAGTKDALLADVSSEPEGTADFGLLDVEGTLERAGGIEHILKQHGIGENIPASHDAAENVHPEVVATSDGKLEPAGDIHVNPEVLGTGGSLETHPTIVAQSDGNLEPAGDIHVNPEVHSTGGTLETHPTIVAQSDGNLEPAGDIHVNPEVLGTGGSLETHPIVVAPSEGGHGESSVQPHSTVENIEIQHDAAGVIHPEVVATSDGKLETAGDIHVNPELQGTGGSLETHPTIAAHIEGGGESGVQHPGTGENIELQHDAAGVVHPEIVTNSEGHLGASGTIEGETAGGAQVDAGLHSEAGPKERRSLRKSVRSASASSSAGTGGSRAAALASSKGDDDNSASASGS